MPHSLFLGVRFVLLRLRRLVLVVTALITAFAPIAAQAQGIAILRDTEIEIFLEDYSIPIFEAAGLTPEAVDIYLVGDQTPNAFVAGGLNMFIHTGLITLADNPNQVEGVIAHEVGHLTGGHNARRSDAFAAANKPLLLSLLLAAGAAAAGAPEAGIGLLGLGQNIGIANFLKYTRGQEASADQAAIIYLERVGSSGKGLQDFFAKLRNFQTLTSRRVNPYLQTHPLAQSRILSLEQGVLTSPYYDVRVTNDEQYRFDMIKGKINGFLLDPNSTFRKYPLSNTSDEAVYARAVAYFRSAQIDLALKSVHALLEKQPNNAFFHELEGQMLFEFGRVHDAIAPHQRSVDLMPDAPLFHINLARAMLATEDKSNFDGAVEHFNQALEFEPDNSLAWFELARAYGGLGKIGMANLATAEHRYHRGDRDSAISFAKRAQQSFKEGSREWRHANDVINAARVAGKNGVGRRPPPNRPERPGETEDDNDAPTTSEAPAPNETPAPAPRNRGGVPDPIAVPDPQ